MEGNGGLAAKARFSYRPYLEFHHHLQRHPSLGGRKHRKTRSFCAEPWTNYFFVYIKANVPQKLPWPPTPPLCSPISPPAQVPPTRTGISQAIDCKLPEGWSVGLPWTLKRSTFSPGTPASLGACALMLCWKPEFSSASLWWPGQWLPKGLGTCLQKLGTSAVFPWTIFDPIYCVQMFTSFHPKSGMRS